MTYISYFLVCALAIYSERAVGAPQATTSAATGTATLPVTTTVAATGSGTVADEFSKSMSAAMANVRGGLQSVASPLLNFGFSLVPQLVRRGSATAQHAVTRVAGAKRDAATKVAGGLASVVGNGVVLGSNLLGNTMQVAGSGLGALNTGMDAGANVVMDIADNVAVKAAQANEIGGNLVTGGLNNVASAMQASAAGATNVAGGLTKLVDSMAARLARAMHESGARVEASMNRLAQSAAGGATSYADGAGDVFKTTMGFANKVTEELVKLMEQVSNGLAAASASAAETGTGSDATLPGVTTATGTGTAGLPVTTGTAQNAATATNTV